MSIEKVRQSVLQLVESNRELYEESDLDILQRDDDYVSSYFKLVDSKLSNNNEANESTIKEVIQLIDETLRRRKRSGLFRFSQGDFPSEFYSNNALALSYDVHGDRVFYILGHMHVPHDDLRRVLVDWFAFEVQKIKYATRGSIIVDLAKVGLSNVDLRLLLDGPPLLGLFPTLEWTIYAVDVHFLINPFFKIAVKFLPKRFRHRIKVVSRFELQQVFGKEFLWTELGGYQNIVNEIPEESCTKEEFAAKRNISIESVQKMMKAWQAVGAL